MRITPNLPRFSQNASSTRALVEGVEATPVALDTELTGLLPEVIKVGEEDRLGADFVGNGLDGDSLLGGTGNSLAVGVTSVRPAGLQVENILARADALKDLDLLSNELAGLVGGDIGVEEGVDVGTDDVANTAQSGAVSLPDVDGLGGGDLASVAGRLEGGLGRGDEAGKGGSIAVAVLDSLITDDDQADEVPLGPLGDSGNLVLGTRDTSAADEDTNDHLETRSPGGLTNVLQAVAVGRVDTDVGETLGLEGSDLGEDGGFVLAVTTLGVRRVGHTHLAADGTCGSRGCAGAGGRSRAGGRHGGGGVRSGGGGLGSGGGGGRDGSGARGSRSRGGLVLAGEGADIGVVGAGDGHSLLRLSVGTRSDDGGSGVDNDGAGRDGGGGGSDGVGASRGADIGGGLDHAGHGGARGLDGGVGADNSGRGLNHSGDTTVGVSTSRQLGSGGSAHGGCVEDGHSGGGNGVDTSRGEVGDGRSGQRDLIGSRARAGRGSGGTGNNSHGGGAGRVQSGDSLGSDGAGSGRRNGDH